MPELAEDVASFCVDGVDDFFPARGLFGDEEAGHAGHAIALVELDEELEVMKR